MTRANAVRVVMALIVLGCAAWLAETRSPRLGLDLRGGTQITLETKDGETAKADATTTDQAIEVLRRRVDGLGVSEPNLTRSGTNRIVVELPGVTDPAEAVEVIGQTAQLSFRPVLGVAEAAAPTPSTPAPSASGTPQPSTSPSGSPAPSGSPSPSGTPQPSGTPSATADPGAPQGTAVTLAAEDGERLHLGQPALTGQQVDGAEAVIEQFGGWTVNVEFAGAGAQAWQKLTADAACATPGDPRRRVAIVLDDQVISSPQVDQSIGCGAGISGGKTSITGQFSAEEAKELALLVRAGALPVPIEVIEQRSVGPTLGKAAIEASVWAAVIGLAATMLFIIAVYRIVGGLAALALAAYGLISYATLLAFGATLTLPGLAGFVLAIGMAVDANVLIFERARQEYAERPGRGLRAAADQGFRKALSAIADSNVTTLLAAGLLFFLASGPVRGFGITLAIGVVASMFTALVLSRALVEFAVNRGMLRRHPRASGLGHEGWVRRKLATANPKLFTRTRLWLGVSVVLVVLAVAGIAIRGVTFGVEFTGGRMVEYSTARSVSVDDARAAVSDAGFPRAVVQESGDRQLTVRDRFDDSDEARIRAALTERAGEVERVRDELIGPSLGAELRNKALIALAVALAAQLVYLAVRFRWQWGSAAVVALAHDVIILVGAFAWLGKPVDGVFLAALLTVIGYSVNDSVVVFDRIRELVRGERRAPLPELASRAVMQTIPRTVNTGLGAVFVLVALAVLGGDSLVDFAVALLIGIVVGTYSSVFTATPLLTLFDRRRPAAGRPARGAGTRPRTKPAAAKSSPAKSGAAKAGTATTGATKSGSARSGTRSGARPGAKPARRRPATSEG